MSSATERFGYPDFAGKTILVIDDHQDSLDFLSELLRFCGAEVWTAWSTAHARARLDRQGAVTASGNNNCSPIRRRYNARARQAMRPG